MDQCHLDPLAQYGVIMDGDKAKAMASIVIASWNTTGSNRHKCEWFNNFSNKYKISLASIQEHFRIGRSTNTYFSKEFPTFRNDVPAVRQEFQTRGRGSGGLTQFWQKKIKIDMKKLPTYNYRIQSQQIKLGTLQAIWINSYHPVGH